MKLFRILWLSLFIVVAQAAWGYGGGSSSKACEKPGFSRFSPPDKAEVSPNTEFSFIASPNTKPQTIKVIVKDIPVPIAVKPVAQGYAVSGVLPAALRGVYARIGIAAEGASQCKGSGGWLLNIGE
ncbi:hypothetical protein [Methylomicrobium agile]|uniref:hypothetical protein n=1 Tax=Methylomicrobium agile TaxID=39774 RepID=UPI0004DFA8D5|nr:hypothetical protein [Methylomicrobium agile]